MISKQWPELGSFNVSLSTVPCGRGLYRISGKYVKLVDTVRSFKEIVDGKYDDLPEQAFYMVGPIEEAIEKAEKLGYKR